MRKTIKKRLAIAAAAIAAAAIAIILSGRIMATSSGYPNPESFSSAEIYVYDSDFNEHIERLSSDEEARLRNALFWIWPMGEKSDQSLIEPQAGWIGEMFLLTMPDGSKLRVKDTYQHILIENLTCPEKSGLWPSNSLSLTALHKVYEDMIKNYK